MSPPTAARSLRHDTGVPDVASSMTLLERARAGDRDALNALIARYLPRLQRWARGRLPQWARGMADTQDLVQETVVRTFQRIEQFEIRGDGALQAYLRQGIVNRIRDEIRRAGVRGPAEALDTSQPDEGASPLDRAIGRQAVERYEAALEHLRPADREAVIAKLEMGYTYDELAGVLRKPSAGAARKTVERALVRLADEMRKLHT